jgi:hypothetical protein
MRGKLKNMSKIERGEEFTKVSEACSCQLS